MLRYLIFLLLLLVSTSGSASSSKLMHIQSQTQFPPINLTLNDPDWRWLGNKKVVRVAIWSPEHPPFVTILEDDQFEGIDADYLHMLGSNLGVIMQVVHYDNYQQALIALKSGMVDAMQYHAGEETPDDQLFISSDNFTPNLPALVATGEHSFSATTNDLPVTVAVATHYMSDSWIKSRFREATIVRYPSDQGALFSVAVGKNQVYLGNLTSANFLIERNYNNQLIVSDIFPEDHAGSRLIFRKDETVLQRTINEALSKISQGQNRTITGQWISGADYPSYEKTLNLTEKEQRWIDNHPDLKVMIDPFYTPFTFYDNQNQLQGIGADLLRQIHLRTRLNFTVVESDDIRKPDLQGDMVAALSHSDERESKMLFTRPYLQTPWVLVVRNQPDAPSELSDGMRVAVSPGNAVASWIQTHYPKVQIVVVANTSLAMQRLVEGKVDAVVNNLISANYMIGHVFNNQLKISDRLTDNPAKIAFAVRRDQPELQSILNKALASIPPRAMSQMVNKWQQGSDVKLTTWTLYDRPFYWLVALSCALIALAGMWIWYMRNEVKQRRRTQAKLMEELAFRETLLNGSPSPVYVINKEGHTLNHNRAFSAFFTHEQLKRVQLPLFDQRHPLAVLAPNVLPLMHEQVQLPQKNFTLRAILHVGENKHVIDHWATAYNDAEGNTAGLICGWQDVTATEKLLTDFSQAKDDAEKASKAKSSFLATMSHEIRTPISAIIGLLELSVLDGQPRKPDDPLSLAWQSAQSLLGIIGDILDMAKIESGQLELEPAWISLEQLVSPTVPVFSGLARLKNLTLDVNSSGDTHYEVWIDALRFKQVLYNFISNALKFTDTGGVTVNIHTQRKKDGRLQFDMSVADTGSGISERERKRLFQPYAQLSAGRRQSGSGLGLFISAELIQKMEGVVELTSEPGKGTTVSLSLELAARPLAQIEQPLSLQQQPVSLAPLHILIVDDQPTNRLLLKSQLALLRHHVDEADDGEQALSLWQENHYDLIITDCNMPGIDGLELTMLIREDDPNQLIFGLTANAQQEERERCLKAGMNDCLFKPLRMELLEQILSQVASRQTAFVIPPALLALANNDSKLVNTLLLRTCEENRKDQQLLQQHEARHEWSMAAKILHRMAGSAQVICLEALDKQCRALEERCLIATPDDDLNAEFRQLYAQLELFYHAVESSIK